MQIFADYIQGISEHFRQRILLISEPEPEGCSAAT